MKNKIEKMLLSTGRKGIEDLLRWMDENGFYNAPCSSRFHLAKPGGLAEHSWNVLRIATNISESLSDQNNYWQTHELYRSIIICSLLHDLGKAGQFCKPNYAVNEDLPFPAYKSNKDLLYIPHEVRSVAIASKFIELTEDEQFAILYHNGLYGELQSVKGNETPLYMILHFADMWASRVIEKEE